MTNWEFYKDTMMMKFFAGYSTCEFTTKLRTGNENSICQQKCSECHKANEKWLLQEYVSKKIEIPKDTPIDTLILVSDDGEKWIKRYFESFRYGSLWVFEHGKKSSDAIGTCAYEYAKPCNE